jgi:hypothetical protein
MNAKGRTVNAKTPKSELCLDEAGRIPAENGAARSTALPGKTGRNRVIKPNQTGSNWIKSKKKILGRLIRDT